jgi:fatty acid desaturase
MEQILPNTKINPIRDINRLSLADLQSKPSDVIFALKFIFYIILIGFGAYLAMSSTLWQQVIGVFLLGAMFAHGVELQHQVLHAQGFKNKTLNEAVGILLGLPMLVSYADYKSSHMHHHKYLGTPENREFFDYGDQYGKSTLRSISVLLMRLFMVLHYFRFVKNVSIALWFRQYSNTTPNVSKRIARDYLIMLTLIIACLVIAFLLGWDLVLRLWILPLILVAAPIHALVEMPEHFRCDTESTESFVNTRTIKTNAFMNWFTNGNNYHVEHHLMPGLPIDRLHDLHAKIHTQCEYLSVSYWAFYFGLLGSMFKGK